MGYKAQFFTRGIWQKCFERICSIWINGGVRRLKEDGNFDDVREQHDLGSLFKLGTSVGNLAWEQSPIFYKGNLAY